MKRNTTCYAIFAAILMLTLSSPVFAYPILQLDISDSYYDLNTETVIASSDTFTLYALLTSDDTGLLNDTYYISAALVPQTSDQTDVGSFTWDGNVIDVTDDMVYGVPPVESNLDSDPHDLQTHSIFPTYFTEFSFSFDPNNRVGSYNSQDDPGGFGLNPYEDGEPFSYYAAFDIDTSGLLPGYVIHFDLYNEIVGSGGDIDKGIFAPFSHDAQSSSTTPVPEPATLLLLGSGLLGVVGVSKKKARIKA